MATQPPPRIPIIRVGIAFEGALGVVAWLLGRVLQQPPMAEFRWHATDAALGVAATGPMLALFFACLRWPVGPLRRIKRISDEFIRPLFAGCPVVALALLSLAAGLCEEMLFRGFLQNLLARRFGLWPGLLTASAVFGLLHAITPTYAVLAGALGLYLGYWFIATENLLTAVVAHALYDFIALVFVLRNAGPPRDGGESLSGVNRN